MSVLDGRTIVERKYITFPKDSVYDTDEQVQPNGVDLRVDQLFLLEGFLELPREGKGSLKGRAPEVALKDGWWELRPQVGAVYLVNFLERALIPDGYCADVITRSTLVRAGADVVTGLWDTGWSGKLGASMRLIAPLRIQHGARIAQILFMESAFNGHRYSGRYQGATSQVALHT